jgi:hypothetical protein
MAGAIQIVGGSGNPGAIILPSYASSYKLAYSPPTLVNPITVTLPAATSVNTKATGSSTIGLDNTKDYIIVMPVLRTSTVQINGGRNIVIIGGHISLSVTNDAAIFITDSSTNGAAAPQFGRVVHIEGVQIDNPNGLSFDGLDYNCPSATVRFQNCRVTGLTGTYNGTHADISQNQGGATQVCYDHITGTCDYQGFFFGPGGGSNPQGVSDGLVAGNTDLSYWEANPGTTPSTELFWNESTINSVNEYTPIDIVAPFVISNNRSGQTVLHNSIYAPSGVTPTEDGQGNITFPSVMQITGSIIDGNANPLAIPNSGFCPVGNCGLGYVSPGYV